MAKSYRTRPYVVPANGSVTWDMSGRYYGLLTTTADLNVSIDDQASEPLPGGVFLEEPGGFDRISIQNPNGFDVTFRLAVSDGVVFDNRFNFSGQIDAAIVADTGLKSTADATIGAGLQATVLAANASRRTVLVKSLKTNPGEIRVGDVSAGLAQAWPLDPGEGVTLTTTAEIVVYNVGGSDAKVALLEVEQ